MVPRLKCAGGPWRPWPKHMKPESVNTPQPSSRNDQLEAQPGADDHTGPVTVRERFHWVGGESSSGPSPNRPENPMDDQWWNRTRYQLYAPVYDWLAKPWDAGRQRAIERLDLESDDRILILGCGTGGDLDYLPDGTEVVAVDLSEAMVRRTATRAERLDLEVDARVGDAQSLPFGDDRFDAVLLHLVLSVVPEPEAVVSETARVLVPDGRVSIYDKFVPAGETPSLLRRAVNPLARLLFADLNRSLEPMLSGTDLRIESPETVLNGIYWVTTARLQREPSWAGARRLHRGD